MTNRCRLVTLIFAAGWAAMARGEGASAPANVASVTKSQRKEMILLTVDKAALRAELKTWPEDATSSQVLRSFKIAIGKAEGDKEVEGDNRTPEGIYFAQDHIDGETLPEKYGTMAIPIDFPNPMDRIKGKTGHGIWLHGVDREQRIDEAKVTEGCVAFYNSDISRLTSWLKSRQGVVVIADSTGGVNRVPDLESVRSKTMSWLKSWADRLIDSYIGHYAVDFSFGPHNLSSYRSYKERVFSGYKKMEVNYDGLRVLTHPKYAVSFFNQDFRGDNHFASIGRKILYWEKADDGEWRIKREVFENRRFEDVTFTDAEVALLSGSASVISSEAEKKSPNL